jgi:hypothetical protein
MSSLKRKDDVSLIEDNANKKLKCTSEDTNLQPVSTQYFDRKELCDFSITYQNKEYCAPSVCLCSQSGYFRALLMQDNNNKCTVEEKTRRITLPDDICGGVSPESLEYMLEHITLNGNIKSQSNLKVVFETCLLCSYFNINTNVTDKVMQKFSKLHRSDKSNAKLLSWKYFSLSKAYTLLSVTNTLADYIVHNNPRDRVNNDDFENSNALTKEDWRELYATLANSIKRGSNK